MTGFNLPPGVNEDSIPEPHDHIWSVSPSGDWRCTECGEYGIEHAIPLDDFDTQQHSDEEAGA